GAGGGPVGTAHGHHGAADRELAGGRILGCAVLNARVRPVRQRAVAFEAVVAQRGQRDRHAGHTHPIRAWLHIIRRRRGPILARIMTVRTGYDIVRDKSAYRSIAFTRKERLPVGRQGLLPYAVATESQLVDRVMRSLAALPRDIDRYMALSSLQERNERLFYRTVIDRLDEILPLIYTPTVGEACRQFSHIAREPKG